MRRSGVRFPEAAREVFALVSGTFVFELASSQPAYLTYALVGVPPKYPRERHFPLSEAQSPQTVLSVSEAATFQQSFDVPSAQGLGQT
jgi:hypothetical protein